MKGWLIYEREDSIKNIHYINEYKKEGQVHGIWMQLILTEDLDFGVQEGSLFIRYQEEQIELPDFAICRSRYPLLTTQLEWMGVMTCNNSQVAEICNDKAKTYQYVAQLQIPMVDTIFCDKDLWKSKQDRIFKNEDKPIVVKTVSGHGGTQVFLLKSEEDYLQAMEKCSGEDFVVQPLTGNKKQDLRVFVLGREIIAAVLRTGTDGFHSNYSLGGSVEIYTLTQEEKKLVYKIVDLFHFDLVGIDFIIGDQGELIFNEIEDVVGSRMLYECQQVNIPKLYLEYILRRIEE